MKKNYLFLILISMLYSCDEYDFRLKVINNTDRSIAVETYPSSSPAYPSVNKTGYYLMEQIAPGDTSELLQVGRHGWPFYIENSLNNRLNLMVYSIDSLEKYNNIDSLIANGIYKSYQFSQDSLEQLGWKIKIK